jgi:hypothetical protein
MYFLCTKYIPIRHIDMRWVHTSTYFILKNKPSFLSANQSIDTQLCT